MGWDLNPEGLSDVNITSKLLRMFTSFEDN